MKNFTKKDILNQLISMKAPNDKPVIVHASLRAVGKLEGGGQTLLDALVEYFTADGGVLIVPTHTWANFDEKKKITLDLNDYKTCTGTLSNIAAADSRSVRTLNPTHSVALFGNVETVERLAEYESKVETPTSPFGVYGKILELGGSVLLIGVGQEKNTLLHCVEEFMSVPNRLSAEKAKMSVKMRDGSVIQKDFYHIISEGIYDVSLFFPKYEPAFRQYGAITDGFIGNAKTQLCSARIMKQVMELIRKNSGGAELLSDDKPLKNFIRLKRMRKRCVVL